MPRSIVDCVCAAYSLAVFDELDVVARKVVNHEGVGCCGHVILGLGVGCSIASDTTHILRPVAVVYPLWKHSRIKLKVSYTM